MFKSETHNNVKIVQLMLFFFGIITVALGFYVDGPRLVQFATDHLSSDKVISEQAIAILLGFRVKIIFLGVFLVLLSILVRYFVLLKNYTVRKIESEYLVERTVSFIGRLLDLVYNIGTNEKFLWCLLILILFGFFSVNIFVSPWGGFHSSEGVNFQPPKNLVKHGVYATLTTAGLDVETHRISAGPGILLPVALVFKLFGIDVYYSRALYAAFIVVTLIVFYRLARDLYGKKVALLALWLLAFSPGMFLTGVGIASGDAYGPALCYFLIGALFWFKSIDTEKNIYLVLSGLFWALSFQTQWLFLFAIFAAVITYITLSFSNKSIGSKYYLIPFSMVFLVTMAWFIFRIFNVGPGRESWHLWNFWAEHGHRAIGLGTEEGVVSSIFALARPIVSLAQVDLWRDFQLFLIIPAILYIIILIGKSKLTDYKSIFLISFTMVWLTWWLLFNYDLAGTHLAIPTAMSQLFIAKLLYDFWDYSSLDKASLVNLVKNKETQKATLFYLLRVAIVCVVLGRILLPLSQMPVKTYSYNLTITKPYKEMMSFIKTNTEKNAVFSGWSWSMPWYVDLDNAGDHINKDRSGYPPEQREVVPEYFIVSPEWPLLKVTDEFPAASDESRWTIEQNEIRKKFVKGECTLVKTFGGDKHKWLLYRVNNDKLAHLPRK